MADTKKLMTTPMSDYRWVFITQGIILFFLGVSVIFLWPIIFLVGVEMLGAFVGILFILDGLVTIVVSILFRHLKYRWIALMDVSISWLSAAILLMSGQEIKVIIFTIAGWAIIKALVATGECVIFKNEVKSIWVLYVKSFLLILLVPLVILSLGSGVRLATLGIAYYFIIHGSTHVILSFFFSMEHEPINQTK
jgi:uncharacterized membrane protein HdeD (DUF308 family)